jgi:hypothetical protein
MNQKSNSDLISRVAVAHTLPAQAVCMFVEFILHNILVTVTICGGERWCVVNQPSPGNIVLSLLHERRMQ